LAGTFFLAGTVFLKMAFSDRGVFNMGVVENVFGNLRLFYKA